MSTHNTGSHKDMTKITIQLSSNIIKYSLNLFFFLISNIKPSAVTAFCHSGLCPTWSKTQKTVFSQKGKIMRMYQWCYNSSLCRTIVYLFSDGASFTNEDSGTLVGSSGFSLGSWGICCFA